MHNRRYALQSDDLRPRIGYVCNGGMVAGRIGFCWPPAMLGYVLDLLASEADVNKEPIVHSSQSPSGDFLKDCRAF
jgi:hypothetical protein